MSSNHSENKFSVLSLGTDIIFLALLIGFGLFLFGSYLFYEYLWVNYQDWIYQAFQVRSLAEHGFMSWDDIWANGMNHWRLYQYLPHAVAVSISKLFSVSLTKAMIIETVGILLFHLSISYILFRKLKIKAIPALLSLVALLTMPQIWAPVKEFSILFPFTLISIFTYLWIQDMIHKRHSFILPALAGIAWVFHPTLAYVTGGLWLFTFNLQLNWHSIRQILSRALIYVLISSVFWLPYFTKGYSFSNPFFASPQFYRDNLPGEQFGFGLLMFSLLGVSWLSILALPRQVPKWTKILLVFVSIFFIFIRIGQSGALPSFILELQFARALPLLGVLLSFIIASIANLVWPRHSRFLKTVGVLLLAFFCSSAIGNASKNAPSAANKLENPAATFVSQTGVPKGRIYTTDIASASFLSPEGTKFVNSYFEHMLPSPSAIRFSALLRNDIAYTGISQQQVDYLISYSHVLGLQYLFLPKLSPSIPMLTRESLKDTGFKAVPFETDSGLIVLESGFPISDAYAVVDESVISYETLKKPTMHATSWKAWDERFVALDYAIREKKLVPIPVSFEGNDKLTVDISSVPPTVSKILLAQSFDSRWKVKESGVLLNPTSERLMVLDLPSSNRPTEIHLENTWPSWHWPLQFTMMGLTVVVIVVDLASRFVSSKRQHRNKKHVSPLTSDPVIGSLAPQTSVPNVVSMRKS
ncbi:hypothetical protein KBD71_01585 [Candidatus Woesebacteria bacterium]|nr:hypothetical protein [Candidatus Woesebacteria bacterium]